MSELDLKKLNRRETVRLLNSTHLGEMVTPRAIERIEERAGLRIGKPKQINVFKLAAWLARECIEGEPKTTETSKWRDYDTVRDYVAKRNKAISASGRDIGPIPEVADPERRELCSTDLKLHLETYHPESFSLEWSEDHIKVIAKLQKAITEGGLFAVAMPRGSGKSTLAECSAIWAILNGYRQFVVLIGADKDHAVNMLDSIKTELETNERLAEDYPEVCFPVGQLEGIAHRCQGQTCQGVRTRIGWTAEELTFPTIPGSKSSGAVLRVRGILGRIRGMKVKKPDGTTIRPDLVIPDDPQTDESAASPSQVQRRVSLMAGAVLGLAGPGKKISGVMPCTVIAPDDMADQILNNDLHPEWASERTKMVYSWPDDPEAQDLWERYALYRVEGLREGTGLKKATEFYRKHRETMDRGFEVAWAARFNHDEISAQQHAMNLKLQDEAAFQAEYQNEPMASTEDGAIRLDASLVMQRINRLPQYSVPLSATHVTAFVDIQEKCLYYTVVAWSEDFSGWVLDYGAWPDPHKNYFTLASIQRTLSLEFPNAGLEGAVYGGLDALCNHLCEREWIRSDGTRLAIRRLMIDANHGPLTDVVYLYCSQSKHQTVVMPSHGRFYGASSQPMTDQKKRPGDVVGHHWKVPKLGGNRQVRHCTWDTNFWKSFVARRLTTAMGDPGAVSFWGDNPIRHRMIADHSVSEYFVRVHGRGREVDEWKLLPNRPDNHLWDCLVGNAVCASMVGCVLPDAGMKAAGEPKRRVAKLPDRRRNGTRT